MNPFKSKTYLNGKTTGLGERNYVYTHTMTFL